MMIDWDNVTNLVKFYKYWRIAKHTYHSNDDQSFFTLLLLLLLLLLFHKSAFRDSLVIVLHSITYIVTVYLHSLGSYAFLVVK